MLGFAGEIVDSSCHFAWRLRHEKKLRPSTSRNIFVISNSVPVAVRLGDVGTCVNLDHLEDMSHEFLHLRLPLRRPLPEPW